MKRNFLYVVLASIVMFTVVSCSSQKNAVKLNDFIVKANEELRIASEVFGKKFEGVTDNNYAALETERQKMVNLIDKKINEISAEKSDMPGGDDFKSTFVNYYKFEKDIYENEYKDICKLTGADGDGERLTAIAVRMQGKATKEDMMEKNIHSEQQRFATKNKLKLQ